MLEFSLEELRSASTPTPALALPWQSAALAIVLTAIPTIFQPCGLGFGTLLHYSRVLRVSPLACLISDWAAIAKILAFTGIHLRNTREGEDKKRAAGFDEFIKYRYPEAYLDEKEGKLDFSSLQQRRLWLGLFFLFVSLPQTIKICACSGPLRLPQFACIAYTITYVFDETILEIATRRQGRTHALILSDDERHFRVQWLSFILESMFITSPMLLNICKAHDYIVEYGRVGGGTNASRPIGFGRLPLSVILAQLTLGVHNIVCHQEQWGHFLRDDEPLFLIVGTCFHLVMLVGSSMMMTGTSKLYDLGIGGMMVLLAALCAYTALKIAVRLAQSSKGKYALHVFLGLYFILVQVSAVLLYFMNGYEKAKTSRPAWTKKLDLVSGLLPFPR